MDTARQIIRWSVPGWVFFLFLFMFDGVTLIFGQRPALWEAVKANKDLLVAITAAGLPIGFLLSQVYSWVYWVFPFPAIVGVGTPHDRARDILRDVMDDIDWEEMLGVGRVLDKQTPLTPTRWLKTRFITIGVKDPATMVRYRYNWLLQEFLWQKTLLENDAEWLDETAAHYSDIYDSLGTTRWSLVLAFLVHTLRHVYLTPGQPLMAQWSDVKWWLLLTVNLILVTFLFRALTSARYEVLEALIQFKHDFITYFHRLSQSKEKKRKLRRGARTFPRWPRRFHPR
jgi:hypothetical protein